MAFKWVPFSRKQMEMLCWWMEDSPHNSKKGIIAEGSVRAGKTQVLSLSYILWSMASFNGVNFGISGKTIGSLRRNLIIPLKEILFARGFKVIEKQSSNNLIISKGKVRNVYYMFGGRDERSQDLVQGVTLAGMFFDEVALMPESFVNQCLARCSISGSKVWFNCNPDGPKHWFKLNFVDKAEEKNLLRLHVSLEDNPSLAKEIIEQYYTMFQGVFYKRYILGEWVQASGVVYDMFDEEKNIYTNPEELPIKCREGDIAAIYGCDFGTQNPQVYLRAYKVRMPNDPLPYLFVDSEYYYSGRENLKQMDPSQYVVAFHQFNGNKKYAFIVVDPSATPLIAAHRNNGDTIRKANNDVEGGISKVATMFTTGHIKINANCKNLISELGMYSWDTKKLGNGKETVVKEYDHCCDALRYIVNTCFSQPEIYGRHWR